MIAKYVLIVSSFYEPNVNKVIEGLESKKIPWLRFNTEMFPLSVNGNWKLSMDSDLVSSFKLDGKIVDCSEISSVWYRRMGKFIFPASFTDQERTFGNGESGVFLRTLFNSIDAHWVNPIIDENLANDKPFQLLVAKKIGFRVPETVITNDPSEVLTFYNQKKSQIVFKPLGGGSIRTVDYTEDLYKTFPEKFKVKPYIPETSSNYQHLFTQILDEQKLAYIESVQLSPLIFQEYIEKDFELRITVVGERIFACAIHSQEYAETKIDFRKFAILDERTPQHKEFILPNDIKEKILLYMKKLNLVFACIDMIVTPEGEYVFLEINPSGQWLWIEEFSGLKITEALVDNLISI